MASLFVACKSPAEGTWEVTELARQPASDACVSLPDDHPMATPPLVAERVSVDVLDGDVYVESIRMVVAEDDTFVGARSGGFMDGTSLVPPYFVNYTTEVSGVVTDRTHLAFTIHFPSTCDGEGCLDTFQCGDKYEGAAEFVEGSGADWLDPSSAPVLVAPIG